MVAAALAWREELAFVRVVRRRHAAPHARPSRRRGALRETGTASHVKRGFDSDTGRLRLEIPKRHLGGVHGLEHGPAPRRRSRERTSANALAADAAVNASASGRPLRDEALLEREMRHVQADRDIGCGSTPSPTPRAGRPAIRGSTTTSRRATRRQAAARPAPRWPRSGPRSPRRSRASDGASTASKRSRSRSPMGSWPGLAGRTALTTRGTREGPAAPASGSKRRKRAAWLGQDHREPPMLHDGQRPRRHAPARRPARRAAPGRGARRDTFAAVTSFQATFAYADHAAVGAQHLHDGLAKRPGRAHRGGEAKRARPAQRRCDGIASGSSPTSQQPVAEQRARDAGAESPGGHRPARLRTPLAGAGAGAQRRASSSPFAGTMARARRPRGTIV